MLVLSVVALFVVFAGGLFVIFGLGYPGYKTVMKETRRNINTALKQKNAMLKENDLKKIKSFPQLKSEYGRMCNEIEINRRERKNTKIGFAVTIGIFVIVVLGCSFWVYTNL